MHKHALQRLRPVPSKRGLGRVIPLRSTTPEPLRIPAASFVPAPLFGEEIFARAFHALQNHLRTIGTESNLLWATQAAAPGAYERMTRESEQAGNVLRELEEYVSPPELCLSTENLANMVERVVWEVAREWERPGRQTRVVCHAPLAALQLDWRQVGKALERITACAYALLPAEGGKVVIEVGLRKVGPQQYMDLKVHSCGAAPLVIEEGALFRPFTRVNGYQLGLSLVLVQRTVSRQHGQMRSPASMSPTVTRRPGVFLALGNRIRFSTAGGCSIRSSTATITPGRSSPPTRMRTKPECKTFVHFTMRLFIKVILSVAKNLMPRPFASLRVTTLVCQSCAV